MAHPRTAELNRYPIGTQQHPYPMTYGQQNAQGRTEYGLGVLQSDRVPMHIYSEKSFAEVAGMMYRDMPTPSMLDVFKRGQVQRQPGQARKVEFFMGDAGAGKSFLGNLNAKMRCKKGAILVDCGGRDLNELIFETVLDYEKGKTLYDAIDSKLAEGDMNPASVEKLRNALGAAFSEQDDTYAIDWEEAGIIRYDETELDRLAIRHRQALGLSADEVQTLTEWSQQGDAYAGQTPQEALQGKFSAYTGMLEADTGRLIAEAKQARDSALHTIREVAELEGLNQNGADSIGIKTRQGPLIRAWKENRPVILDEYNKGKPGTDDALQVLWQVFNGEMSQHTVAKGSERFTFDRALMPPNFFVTLTGNKSRDGYSTRPLSASAYQRLKPYYIEPPTVADLQHRICQQLTGMPVSTIYAAQEEYWKEHKQDFTDFLVTMRKLGLSDEQQANIPSWQFEMLRNWENVLVASEQLAVFYDRWAQGIDPDSKLHNTPATAAEMAKVVGEIDRQYAAEVGIGLRRMMSHIEEAKEPVPEAISSSRSSGMAADTDWTQPSLLDESALEPIEERFGSRLSTVIMNDINSTTSGKDELLTWLLRQAAEAGLFAMLLEEGRSTGGHLIADLLNISPERAIEIPENLKEIHDVLCDYLRKKYPDIDAEISNNALISPSALEHLITQFTHVNVEHVTTRSAVLNLLQLNDETEQLHTTGISVESTRLQPLSEAASADEVTLHDAIKTEEQETLRHVPDLPASALVDAEHYLISLAIPGMRTGNVQALFNPPVELVEKQSGEYPIDDIKENIASNGLAATIMAARITDEHGTATTDYMHVVHDNYANNGAGRTLITGSMRISPRLHAALEKNGVTYVSRDADNAAELAGEALQDIIGSKQDIRNTYMCLEHMLTMAIGGRQHLRAIGEQTINSTKYFEYDLPHGIEYTKEQPAVIDETLRAKHRENLVSLLTDDRGQLASAQSPIQPVYLTDCPDLDNLKNTVRALAKSDPSRQAAATR